jgi:hypothetical protein
MCAHASYLFCPENSDMSELCRQPMDQGFLTKLT